MKSCAINIGAFCTWLTLSSALLSAAPVHLVMQSPVEVKQVAPQVWLVDFGRVAFGNLRVSSPQGSSRATVTIHFGEALKGGRIDREPPGTVRYNRTELTLEAGQSLVAAPPPDPRNTEPETDRHPPAILTPQEWGVILPFRWIEVEGWPGPLRDEHVTRQAAFAASWDDEAAAFHCSNEVLNQIWELCRYSIKATTFAGLYVDGDRERIPYEADAYLNQLSHYATDNDSQMARDTFDWLIRYPTWPSEWAPHMVFMAYADWMHTGDTPWLEARFDALKSKLLVERVGPDGLVSSNEQQMKRDDIVDWPKGERDGFVFTPTNTVVNAFHLRALQLMAEMAEAVGRADDAATFKAQHEQKLAVFQDRLFDAGRGLYRDGTGTEHVSLHANLFPLAFGLVPDMHERQVARWLAERGMACSVYAAQYYLEGLLEHGADREAVQLITASTDRSWRHMLESGTTITWEAWDMKYKPNQDWNHAWGAAPANLLPRYVLGVQPATPGWEKAKIRPCTGGLSHAGGKVPTPRGPVLVEWYQGETFRTTITLPDGMLGQVALPAVGDAKGIWSDGQPLAATRQGDRWLLDAEISGTISLEIK